MLGNYESPHPQKVERLLPRRCGDSGGSLENGSHEFYRPGPGR
jgi:hypothetical protein